MALDFNREGLQEASSQQQTREAEVDGQLSLEDEARRQEEARRRVAEEWKAAFKKKIEAEPVRPADSFVAFSLCIRVLAQANSDLAELSKQLTQDLGRRLLQFLPRGSAAVTSVTDRQVNGGGANSTRYVGKVKSYSSKKAFGFLEMPGFNRDIFVYTKQLIGRMALIAGEDVEFELSYDERQRPQARRVKVLTASQMGMNLSLQQQQHLLAVPSPAPIDDSRFAGRSFEKQDLRANIFEAQQIATAQQRGAKASIGGLMVSGDWQVPPMSGGSHAFASPWPKEEEKPEQPRIPNGTSVTIVSSAVPLQELGNRGEIEGYDATHMKYIVGVESTSGGNQSERTRVWVKADDLNIDDQEQEKVASNQAPAAGQRSAAAKASALQAIRALTGFDMMSAKSSAPAKSAAQWLDNQDAASRTNAVLQPPPPAKEASATGGYWQKMHDIQTQSQQRAVPAQPPMHGHTMQAAQGGYSQPLYNRQTQVPHPTAMGAQGGYSSVGKAGAMPGPGGQQMPPQHQGNQHSFGAPPASVPPATAAQQWPSQGQMPAKAYPQAPAKMAQAAGKGPQSPPASKPMAFGKQPPVKGGRSDLLAVGATPPRPAPLSPPPAPAAAPAGLTVAEDERGHPGCFWRILNNKDFTVVKVRENIEVKSVQIGELQIGEVVKQRGAVMMNEGKGLLRMGIEPRGFVTVTARHMGGPTFMEICEDQEEARRIYEQQEDQKKKEKSQQGKLDSSNPQGEWRGSNQPLKQTPASGSPAKAGPFGGHATQLVDRADAGTRQQPPTAPEEPQDRLWQADPWDASRRSQLAKAGPGQAPGTAKGAYSTKGQLAVGGVPPSGRPGMSSMSSTAGPPRAKQPPISEPALGQPNGRSFSRKEMLSIRDWLAATRAFAEPSMTSEQRLIARHTSCSTWEESGSQKR